MALLFLVALVSLLTAAWLASKSRSKWNAASSKVSGVADDEVGVATDPVDDVSVEWSKPTGPAVESAVTEVAPAPYVVNTSAESDLNVVRGLRAQE